MNFLSRLLTALRNAFAAVFGFARDTLSEAAEPITRHWPAVKRGLGYAPSYAAIGAGAAIGAPAAVLRGAAGLVGSMIPMPAPSPAAVAEAAVASDAPVAPRRSYAPAMMGLGDRIQGYARAMERGDTAKAASLSSTLTTSDAHWLAGLSPEALKTLTWMAPARIMEHISATSEIDRSPLLPPVVYVADAPATVARNVAHRRLAREALADCERPLPGMAFGR